MLAGHTHGYADETRESLSLPPISIPNGAGCIWKGARGLYVNEGIGYVGLAFPLRCLAGNNGAYPTTVSTLFPLTLLVHLHLNRNTFTHFLYVGNDSDLSVPCICSCSKASMAVRQAVSIQRAESFVDKQGFYFQVIAR